MKLKFRANYHAKFHGGLFLGLRFNFPITILDTDSESTYKLSSLNFGLILFTLSIDFTWGKKIENFT